MILANSKAQGRALILLRTTILANSKIQGQARDSTSNYHFSELENPRPIHHLGTDFQQNRKTNVDPVEA